MNTKTVIGALALLYLGGCLPMLSGCTATLKGGGEIAIGMRNTNMLVLSHTVDGDKEGKEAQSNLDVPAMEEWILGDDEPEPTTEPEG